MVWYSRITEGHFTFSLQNAFLVIFHLSILVWRQELYKKRPMKALTSWPSINHIKLYTITSDCVVWRWWMMVHWNAIKHLNIFVKLNLSIPLNLWVFIGIWMLYLYVVSDITVRISSSFLIIYWINLIANDFFIIFFKSKK